MHASAREVTEEQLQGHDVCIVGAGAAGLCLAQRLLQGGLRVLVLDAGDWSDDPKLNDAYLGRAEAPHPPTTEYRRQRVGGTTHLWGGRCVPFDPIDLEPRAHVPHSGWPISHGELSSHYAQAMDWCDAGAPDFGIQSLVEPRPMFGGLERLSEVVEEHLERYSLPTDFGKKFKSMLDSHASLLLLRNARVTELRPSATGDQLEHMVVRCTQTNRELRIQATHFVLAAGGIESTRLMLATRRQHPDVWSHLDSALGLYYTCHFDAIVGQVKFDGPPPRFFFEKSKDGVYCRRKLQLSAHVQRQHQLLNAVFRLHFPAYADPSHRSGVLSAIYLAKSVLPKEHQAILNHGQAGAGSLPKHLQNVLSDAFGVMHFGWQWLFSMKLAKRKLPYTLIAPRSGWFPLEFNSEQVPHAANRITLLDELDSQGMPRVHVHWKLQTTDISSALKSFKLMQHHLNTSTKAQLLLPADEVLQDQLSKALPVGGHHMGTTRMGLSPETSVVDAELRVHGVKNLHICASSVMPTSSHANPTMVLLGLTSRLAEILSRSSTGSR